jgi:hypothetical protein
MNTMKRLYIYGVSFVALVVTASGTSLLFRYLLDQLLDRNIAGGTAEQLSLGVAMIVVGWPLWIVHWLMARRQLDREPQEATAVLRKLYIYSVMFLAALLTFVSVVSLLRWVFGTDTFDSGWVGQVLAWGTVWAYHWNVERREGQPSADGLTLRRWYTYATSLYGLSVMASGIAGVLGMLLGGIYDALTNGQFMVSGGGLWGEGMLDAMAAAIAGGAWWAFHWLYFARGDVESTLRQVYLYIFAFLGGALTVLFSVAGILNGLLRWLLSVPGLSEATIHFRLIADLLPATLVGGALLTYHWQVVREDSQRMASRIPGARRSFGYAMSAMGLGAMAAGMPMLIGLVIGLLIPSARDTLTGADAWRGLLATALTLLIIGAPLWFWSWPRIQRQVTARGIDERTATSRRIYVYGVMGILALAALGSLIGFLTMLLTDLLRGELSLDFLRDGKWLLGVVATACALLPYHWQVLREDQEAGAEAVPARKSVTLLIGEDADEFTARLEEALGTRIRVMQVVAPEGIVPALSDAQVAELVAQVQEAPSARVILIAAEDGVRAYPYR